MSGRVWADPAMQVPVAASMAPAAPPAPAWRAPRCALCGDAAASDLRIVAGRGDMGAVCRDCVVWLERDATPRDRVPAAPRRVRVAVTLFVLGAALVAAPSASARTAGWRCHDGRYEARVERGITLELAGRVRRVEDTHCTATSGPWWYTTTLVYADPPPDLTAWRCLPRNVRRYRWHLLERGTGPFRRFPSWEIGVIRRSTVKPSWRGVVCAGLVPYGAGENGDA